MEVEVGSDDLESRFNAATNYIATASFDVSANDRLYFYAHYKQATLGPCNISKPGLFDLTGRKKWEAWKNLGQLNKAEAMKLYIAKILEIDPSWEERSPTKIGWVCVSTLIKEAPIDEDKKNVFDYTQENDLDKLKTLSPEQLTREDESKMTPLHWACDRGFVEVVRYLLDTCPENINSQDSEGQTPLHYAVSCSHEGVIKLLLQRKAKTSIKDLEGMLPVDCAQDQSIVKLLSSKP